MRIGIIRYYEGFKQLQLGRRDLRKPLRAIDPTGRRMAFIVYDETNIDGVIRYFDERLRGVEGLS